MTDQQLYLAVGLPIIAVITSLVISLIQISGIRGDMRDMRRDMQDNSSGIRRDMQDNMREIREDVREIRNDIKLLTGKVIEIDNRLTRLEERFSS